MIFRLLRLYYQKLKTSEIKTLIHIIICSLVFSVALLLSETLWPNLQYIGHLAFLLIPMSFIFFLIRYPAYFNKAQEESQEIRYRNSQLGSVNKEEVVAGLDALLKQEKIYIDRTVTLSNLSSRLNISSAQLSEFLNSQYGTNFNNFINSYRIEEVKRILNNSPDTNVLETAFNCGFNSKSAFNTNFRKFTGLTPSEYKKKVSS
ncbi:MAG: helix-turn-helix domain-containing protein [Spirochaetales bacterium]|uniref:Helix-turn-helix domain-containing protein n=1 Tax=Candidatus Thalassospirochaeta sargassi TaxID=3119039 RepID=A0AAJ1IEY4_9SPIO|nr:helix-turn-helix domain-containing protein [Spirochaetales bacterium]